MKTNEVRMVRSSLQYKLNARLENQLTDRKWGWWKTIRSFSFYTSDGTIIRSEHCLGATKTRFWVGIASDWILMWCKFDRHIYWPSQHFKWLRCSHWTNIHYCIWVLILEFVMVIILFNRSAHSAGPCIFKCHGLFFTFFL